ALHQLDLQVAHDLCPPVRLSTVLPLKAATVSGERISLKPFRVACTTLKALSERIDLVKTSWMPANSQTARTPPPAMMPVPGEAGLNMTREALNTPTTSWNSVVPFMGT